MWNFRRPGGSGTEQPTSDAMPARDVLPVSHSPLFLWRATPLPFLKEKRKWGRKTQADEYPQGAGRICNAPSSRTAALGIGPYIFYRRFSDFHTPQVQSKALVDRRGPGKPSERFPRSSLSFSYWNRKATQHSGRLSGRKTEAANMELSPPRRKRNGTAYF